MRSRLILFLATTFLAAAPALQARPEYLALYAADPWSRPELRTCLLCHVSAAGSGPRNEFGRAVEKADHHFPESLRRQFPDRFLWSKASPAAESQGRPVKAIWSATRANEVVVEIGDESFLLNRADGSLAKLTPEQAAAFAAPPTPGAAGPVQVQVEKEEPLELRTLPTFDYYLVNLPTNRPRPPRSLHLHFTHRFDEPLSSGTGRLRDLFGFDGFSVSSFGIEAGINRWLSFTTYRMPKFLGLQTIELGPLFRLLEQGGRAPVSLSVRATVEGQRNFTERYTTNFQPVISRAFGTRAEIFVVPTFSLGVPRRTLTFDQPITPGERRDNMAAIGLGASVRIRPKVALVAEWVPRVAGFRGFETRNTYSFAIQRRTTRHVFGLVFSNNSLTTTTRSLTDGRDDVSIGFNLYRRIW